MSGRGDERATRALHGALAEGPGDILDLLVAMREGLGAVGILREGVLHALLHREVRSGRVTVAGFSARGLPLYADPDDAPESASVPGEAAGDLAPLEATTARNALRVAEGVRDPAARGRVHADVVAHLQQVAESGTRHRFGAVRAARSLLQRVDRGRPTVCLTATAPDVIRRFLLHEGPWLAAAVLVFFLLKAFLLQVYRIPSSSMLPTLQVGDRVVVFRPGGRSVPERWAVITFEREGITYVKRVVGLSGERIELRNGDVYVDGTLLVKPEAVRQALRFPLEDWDFAGKHPGWNVSRPDDPDELDPRTWRYGNAGFGPHPGSALGNAYALRDGYLTLDVTRGNRGDVRLVLARGPGDRGNATRWTLQVGVQGIELREGEVFGGEAPAVEAILAEAPGFAPAGDVRLELSYVDGVLRARCGTWSWHGAREAHDEALMPEIFVRGPATRARRLRLDGDLHYANLGHHGVPSPVDGEAQSHTVAEGSLFVMGDNTTNSTDSRYRRVGDIPIRTLVGPVSFRIWPPGRIGTVR